MPALLVSELDAKRLEDRYLIIDTFDTLTGWSITGAGATQSLDTVNYRSGGNALKMTVPASIAAISQKTFGPINLSGVDINDQIRFWVYVDVASRVASATIQMVDNQGSPVTATFTLTGLVNGWNRFSVPKSAFTNGGTVRWSTISIIKLNVTATAAGTVNVTWDMLRMMLGPIVNYTGGRWDESHGSADITDGLIRFWDAGYWQLNDVRILPIDFYRLDKAAIGITVELGVGYARVSGINGSFALLEIINTSWDSKEGLRLEEPWYYRNSAYMNTMRGIQALPASTLMAAIIDVFRQSFVALATYMLAVHEKLLDAGDQSGSGLSLIERRNIVAIRYVAAFLPMNIVGMKRLVEFFVDSAVVTHNPAASSFAVQVVSPKGVPPTSALLTAAIDRAKPAHLTYTITYTFTAWDTMDAYNRTWNLTETYTWDSWEIS